MAWAIAAVPFPDANAAAMADAVALPPLLDTADEIACAPHGCMFVYVPLKNDLSITVEFTDTYGIH